MDRGVQRRPSLNAAPIDRGVVRRPSQSLNAGILQRLVGGQGADPGQAIHGAAEEGTHCFEDLMMQQAYLSNEIDRVYKITVSEHQEEVRRLKAHLNCALFASATRTGTTDMEDSGSENGEYVKRAGSLKSQNSEFEVKMTRQATNKHLEDPDSDSDTSIKSASSSSAPHPPAKKTFLTADRANNPAPPPKDFLKLLDNGGGDQLPGEVVELLPLGVRKSLNNIGVLPQMPRGPGDAPGIGMSESAVSSRRPSFMNPAGLPAALPGLGGDAGIVEPWPIWYDVCELVLSTDQEADAQEKEARERMTKMQKMRKMAKSMDFHHLEKSQTGLRKFMQHIVLHPSSPKRLCWVSVGVMMVVYDMIMLPMSAFDLPMQTFTDVISYIISTFWTLDLVLNFFTGFHLKGGKTELRLRKIGSTYMKTWFPADAVLVAIDWAVIIMDRTVLAQNDGRSGTSSARLMKTVRAMRILRSIRLIRVVKLPGVFKEVKVIVSVGRSEYFGLVFGICKHLSSILLAAHIISCMFYFIGKGKSDGWVVYYTEPDAVWYDLYLTSLHWSLAQLTPAPNRIQPRNYRERMYTVTIIIMALITFSSFVSSITNLMNQRRMLKSTEAKQFAKLEHYLHDNHISFHLASRVRRFLEHSVHEAKRKPHEANVELIPKLSEPLRQELHLEVHGPVVSKHPFFMNYMHLNLPAMQKLCHTCIKDVELSMDDILFNRGETATAMYFVTNGELEYSRPCDGEDHTPLSEGSWVTEMVLWTPWEHRGMMKATSESSLNAVHYNDFHDVICAMKAGQLEASAYAIEAVRLLNDSDDKDSPTDLDGWPFDSTQICSQIFKTTQNKKGHWLRAGQGFHRPSWSAEPSEIIMGHVASHVDEKMRGSVTEKLRSSMDQIRQSSEGNGQEEHSSVSTSRDSSKEDPGTASMSSGATKLE